jgi:hypothetical protein
MPLYPVVRPPACAKGLYARQRQRALSMRRSSRGVSLARPWLSRALYAASV